MTTSLIVLRTSVLIMFLLSLVTGFYVLHVNRLAADAAAQSAAVAAAQAATAAGWDCGLVVPAEAHQAAAIASAEQIQHLAVQPISVELHADACNLLTTVTTAPLSIRANALATTAVACRSTSNMATLNVPASC